MTAVRQIQDNVLESSDSSDSSMTTVNNNETNLNLYKSTFNKCNDFVNKLDSYNNNQLLLPTQFYKTLLAKAVLSSSNSDDKNNVYKNMLFHKEREFDQVISLYFAFFYGYVLRDGEFGFLFSESIRLGRCSNWRKSFGASIRWCWFTRRSRFCSLDERHGRTHGTSCITLHVMESRGKFNFDY